LYLMRIRDESHRFGITFHRKLRQKNTLHSPIDNIQGVGDKRKKLMLKTLGSYKKIKAASPDDLTNVPGIGPKLALSIYNQLHNHSDAT